VPLAKQLVVPAVQTAIPSKQPELPTKQPALLTKQPALPSNKKPVLPAIEAVLPSTKPVQPSKQPSLLSKQTQPAVFLTNCKCESPVLLDNQCMSSENSSYHSTDIQILGAEKASSLSLASVMQKLHAVKHVVNGDGSCLYHAVAHQAGFITKYCKGNEKISLHLRKVAVDTMLKYPSVCSETGLSKLQWLGKQFEILKPDTWGGDLELCLLAIGFTKGYHCSYCYN